MYMTNLLFSKYFIILNLIMFSLFSLMLYDMLILWFILEINNFLFITLLNFSMKNKKMIFFYFIIQMLSSFILMFSFIMNMFFIPSNYHLYMITILALLIKLSIPPFHFWLPLISNYLPWNILFILLTFQKITPFYMLSLINIKTLIIFLIIILCSTIPPYFMLNWNNFKTIMTYSSINQSSWMIILISMKNIIWFKYFLFYSITLFPLFYFFNLFKMFKNFNTLPSNLYMITALFFLNLTGMPPFSFFFMKWYSIFLFISNNFNIFFMIIMMFSSLIMLYIYMHLMIYLMFIYSFKSKLINTPNPIFNNKMILLFFLSLFSSLILLIL